MKVKLDYDRLRTRCTQSEKEITDYAITHGFIEIQGKTNSAWFKDNGSPVLAVAHMDTVQKDKFFSYMKLLTDSVIYSPYLDDRVGVYTVLDMLPRLGIKCDVLLTTDEESCNSSAKLFQSTKKYNWLVEFDRKGEDVVTYGMETVEWLAAMEVSKFKLGCGTYSDIASMHQMNCCAVNIGVGYQNCHDKNAYMMVGDFIRNMKRFVNFYHKNKDMAFPCEHKAIPIRGFWWDDRDEHEGFTGGKYLSPRKELNETTGVTISTDQQRCPDCQLELDYLGMGEYMCWVCDKEWEYDYNHDSLEEYVYGMGTHE